jgi:hypothetical protein
MKCIEDGPGALTALGAATHGLSVQNRGHSQGPDMLGQPLDHQLGRARTDGRRNWKARKYRPRLGHCVPGHDPLDFVAGSRLYPAQGSGVERMG